MSQLETWSDVQGLIGTRESEQLDFKRELPKQAHDFGKDIAAMTRTGGAIVYGIDEDKAAGIADRVTPVPVAGAEERIRQSVKHIRPELHFDVAVVTESRGDSEGVVVVRVHASSDWPIMVNDRFPVRYGTTTRYLDGNEVREAIVMRHPPAAAAPPSRIADLFDPLVAELPGITDIRARSTFHGHAFVRVAVRRADGRFPHPEAPWLGPAFEQARTRAESAAAASIEPGSDPRFLHLVRDWKARDPDHWVAGYAGGDEGSLAKRARGSAVLDVSTGHLLMEVTRPTGVFDHSDRFGYHCAFEPYVAAELWVMLRFAGELFIGLNDAVGLHSGLHLAGFEQCVSHHATHAEDAMIGRTGHLPVAPSHHLRQETADARELIAEDGPVARRLLDPWLAVFYEDAVRLFDKVLVRLTP